MGISDTTSTNESIEESLGSNIQLEQKVLEELKTKIKISSIEVEGYVYEVIDAKTMDIGFWHFPISQYPGQKGNSVIIGHRYAKLPPDKDTFFNLDKVKIGDRITVEQYNKLLHIHSHDTKGSKKRMTSLYYKTIMITE